MGKRGKTIILEKVRVEKMAAEGKCIAYHNDQVVFVNQTAPGDLVDIRITRKRKKFMEGTPIHFHEYSDLRITPFCEHFDSCGGCKWQHLPYEKQLEYKHQQIAENFQRIGKIDIPEISPILPSEETRYYRNKLEFAFSSKRWFSREEIESGEELDRRALGFHMPQSFDKILQIEHCYLQPSPSNELRLAIDDYARKESLTYYDANTHEGLLRTLTIRTSSTGDSMIVVQFGKDGLEPEATPVIENLLKFIEATFPDLTSIQYVINAKKNDTYQDQEVKVFAGASHITEEMEGLKFRISAKSFYQTNSAQAYNLYKVARSFADLTGEEIVYDLYTGTGTIANFVAAKAQKVVGLEYVDEAIEDAKVNAQLNKLENTDFYAGDIKDLLQDEFIHEHGKPDVIITDPPRMGMHPDVVKKLMDIKPKKIVYVSCGPATQARDIAMMDEFYTVTKIQPVDMFPHTHHVENVALLELKV